MGPVTFPDLARNAAARVTSEGLLWSCGYSHTPVSIILSALMTLAYITIIHVRRYSTNAHLITDTCDGNTSCLGVTQRVWEIHEVTVAYFVWLNDTLWEEKISSWLDELANHLKIQ